MPPPRATATTVARVRRARARHGVCFIDVPVRGGGEVRTGERGGQDSGRGRRRVTTTPPATRGAARSTAPPTAAPVLASEPDAPSSSAAAAVSSVPLSPEAVAAAPPPEPPVAKVTGTLTSAVRSPA